MAFDRQFLKLEWIFEVANADEIAITGCHASGLVDFDAVQALDDLTTGDLEDLADLLVPVMNTASVGWCNFSTLAGIKVSARGTDGLYLTDAKTANATTGTLTGASAVGSIQDTIVLSLRTPVGLGRARFGRMYLPHTFIGRVSSSPFMTQSTCAALAATAATCIGAINTVLESHTEDANVVNMSSVGAGRTLGVTQVAVGNVLDTQRRRRRQLQETYSFDTV